MLLTGDENINAVLNDPDKMNLMFTVVTQEIREVMGQNQPQQQSKAPQRNLEAVSNQVEMEPTLPRQ